MGAVFHGARLPDRVAPRAAACLNQSTFSRFFARCERFAGEALSGLHAGAVRELPVRTEGYTLDLDSVSLIYDDGQQKGVRVGYTRKWPSRATGPSWRLWPSCRGSRISGSARATPPAGRGR